MLMKIPGVEIVEQPSERVALHKLADGSSIAFGAVPMRGDTIPKETHAVAAPVREAVEAFSKLEEARRAARDDKGLNEIGRAAKVKTARETTAAAMAEAESKLAQMGAATAGLSEKAFAPPELEASDYNGGLIDQEIRTHVRSLPSDQRAAYLQTLATKPRHLEALMRSPVPIEGASEYANRLWQERLEKSPDAISAQGYRDALDWGLGTLGSMKSKI
jgi:hypothetical protein